MRHPTWHWPLLLLLAVSLVGAWARPAGALAQAGTPPAGTSMAGGALPVKIAATAKVLSAATMQYLELPNGALDLTQPTLVLTFSTSTPELASLNPGDTLVSGVTPSTPDGLLRKVVSITTQGAQVVVVTAPASLTDVIQQGSLEVKHQLTPGEIARFTPLAAGVTLGQQAAQPGLFCVNFTNLSLYATTTASVTATGFACLGISFDLSLSVQAFPPQLQAALSASASEGVDVQVTAIGTATTHQKKEIGRLTLTPIVFTIGPIPVVITPVLILSVGVDGQVTAQLTDGVEQSANLSASISCTATLTDSGCSANASQTNRFALGPLSVHAATALKGYAEGRIEFLLYGVVGLFLAIQGSIEADSNSALTLGRPCLSCLGSQWIVYGGLQVTGGVTLDLGPKSIDWGGTLIDVRTVLAQGQIAK